MIKKIPSVNFKVRERDDSIEGDNPFKWETKSTDDYFANKKVILFSHFWPILAPHGAGGRPPYGHQEVNMSKPSIQRALIGS